jgi:integrase
MTRHKRGLGVVRFRKDIKKYVIDYYDNFSKRHVETIGTNKHEAIDKLKEKIRLGDSGVSQSDISFKTYIESWFERKTSLIEESTRISYEGILNNHLIPYFGKANLSEIKKINIKNFANDKVKDRELSLKTIRNILVVLHEVLGEAEDDGLIANNPYPSKINKQLKRGIQLSKENDEIKNQKVDHLEKDEIHVFLNACQDQKEEPQNYPLFYIAIFTGVRRGELLALKWGDIDWNKKIIKVQRSLYKNRFKAPKTENSVRDIDVDNYLLDILKQHKVRQDEIRLKIGKEWNSNDLIFCQKDGNPLDADNLYHRDFHRVLKRAGLRQIRIHDLRHTFASILITANHNIKYMQEQMGHASIQTTMDRYGHLMKASHDGAARKTRSVVFGEDKQREAQTGT